MWWWLLACSGGAFPAPGDDDDDDAELALISVSCDADAGVWSYEARTNGYVTGGLVDVRDTTDPDWHEQHTLIADDSQERLVRELVVVADYTDYVPDATTLYTCPQGAALTFWLRVYGRDGDESDCAVWGADPAVWAAEGCDVWEA